MNTKHLNYLLHPVFLTGLFLLLLNDHYLKAAYGNWWTGKLSDFAGVLILPLFLRALFGVRTRYAILGTVLFFAWWKSPLSQSFIDGLDALAAGYLPGLRFVRVVDMTDLLAFAVLPLSCWVLRQAPPRALRLPLARAVVLPVTLLAFVATSDPNRPVFMVDGTIGSCCSNTQLVVGADGGTFYLPTAFTPDGDGINDVLHIHSESTELTIDSFIVTSLRAGERAYVATDVTDFTPQAGFDGVVSDSIQAERFEVTVYARANGQLRAHTTHVCSLPCATPSGLPRPEFLDNCLFPNQYQPGTGFNRDLFTGEEFDDCFEN